MISLGNAIGIPFGWGPGSLVLPSCTSDLAVAWYKDLNARNKTCEIGIGETTVEGLLDFDGGFKYIELSSHPSIEGSSIISFNLYFDTVPISSSLYPICHLGLSGTDQIYAYIHNGFLIAIGNSTSPTTSYKAYDISGLSGENLYVLISKTTGNIESISINGSIQSEVVGTLSGAAPSSPWIGRSPSSGVSFQGGVIYDFTVNSSNRFPGFPNGNTSSGWDDVIGSITATVFGSPSTRSITYGEPITTYYCIEDKIGTREDTVFFGQYLSSGTIDFGRNVTIDYTDPSTGNLVEGVSASPTLTVPANGICDIGVYPRYINNIYGLLDFDGVDDEVELASQVDVTGDQTITFDLYLKNSLYPTRCNFLNLGNSTTDRFEASVINNTLQFITNKLVGSVIYQVSLGTTIPQEILSFSVVKTAGTISTITINGLAVSIDTSNAVTNATYSSVNTIGNGFFENNNNSLADGTIFNVIITGSHSWAGQPNGDLNSAWVDSIGPIDGAVQGSPTTFDIITNTEEDITYTSSYPCCERAGTVLHDVKEDSKHISVTAPVWGETLYGSDYLNQQGYVDKADFTAEGYDFETVVDGTPITLDDNCLVPLAQWDYVNLIDSEGEVITDSGGEIIQVKQNL